MVTQKDICHILMIGEIKLGYIHTVIFQQFITAVEKKLFPANGAIKTAGQRASIS